MSPRSVAPAFALILAACLAAPALAQPASTPPPSDDADPPAETTGTAVSDDPEEEPAEAPPSLGLRDTITVTATRSSLPVESAPGHVDVIDAREIERRLVGDAADLVRYEPGVYTDSDPTRLGVGGFNIRGIGGNRVLTRVDGVPVADGFDFERLAIPRYSLDPEVLQRVEIVRSAGSSLYGSEALGGVVSLLTRDPGDFLQLGDGGAAYVGVKTGWDGRRDEASAALTLARGGERWQGSLWASHRNGGELDNQGTVTREDALRTAPNPIDRRTTNVLGKLTYAAAPSVLWKLTAELFDARTETEALSRRGSEDLGPGFGPGVTFRIDTLDFDADDRQERWRLSLDRTSVAATALYDEAHWRLYGQRDETEQVTLERRETTVGGGFFGPPRTTPLVRDALLTFEQEGVGLEVQLQKSWDGSPVGHRLTYGAAASRDRFDTLRDRTDRDPESDRETPSSSPFPTKYFPESTRDEVGVFVQDEITLANGRLLLVPGLRWDRFSLDPDAGDAVFASGNPGNPAPVGMEESALSPRFGAVLRISDPLVAFAQYSRGFRAPSYGEVNTGFSNVTFGYRTLPNPDLEPETSDNVEVGLRWTTARAAFSLTGFDNRYDDFIEMVVVAVDRGTGFIDFQSRNVASAHVRGVEASADLRLGAGWRLRGAYARIRGDDEENDQPLNSIAPPRLVVGLAHHAPSGRWGAELTATVAEAKDPDRVDRSTFEQFATPGYEVLDLTGYYELPGGFSIQAGLFNLLDETYWRWPNAAGLVSGSPVLERYTSPGFNAALTLRYRR